MRRTPLCTPAEQPAPARAGQSVAARECLRQQASRAGEPVPAATTGHAVVPNNFDVMGMLLAPLIGQDGQSMLLEAGLQLLQSADKNVRGTLGA